MFGVVDSDTVTYLNWFTFVLQVEMFGVVDSDTDTSGNEFLLELVDIQKSLFSELGLHFRLVLRGHLPKNYSKTPAEV